MNASPATSVAEVASISLTQRIREEFEEAPDLRMNVSEAASFWGLDQKTCAQVLGRLLATGFLTRGDDGRYRQA